MFKRFTLLLIVLLLVIAPAAYAAPSAGNWLENPQLLQDMVAKMPRVQRSPGVFYVNTTDDLLDLNPGDGLCLTANGNCSFRAAIHEASAIDPGSVIYVPAGTYVLSVVDPLTKLTTLPVINSIKIFGAGAGKTIVDGNGLNSVFWVGTGTTLQGLTVTGGIGGLDGNGNRVGGGIIVINLTPPSVLINDVEITGNSANLGAGIVIAQNSSVNIMNTTIAGNTATLGETPVYPFTGGGLLSFNAVVSLSNVTISGNSAPDGAGLVAHQGSDISLNNTTIAFNTSTITGAGINFTVDEISPEDSVVTLRNSIIASNIAPAGPDCNGAVASQGNNLVSNTSDCTGLIGTDTVNTDALLAPLALNLPGTTQTHALLAGSPAIDSGNNQTCLPVDQRGMSRSGNCDMGAYEFPSDLLMNGGFEAKDENSKPDLTPWALKNGTKDKIKCKVEVAHSGDCAFQFAGGAGENSKIQQVPALAGITFASGTDLSFGAWINASNPATQGKLKVRVKYSDSTPPGKITQNLALTSGYTEHTGIITIGSTNIAKIKVQIKHTSPGGKVYVDDVSLGYQPAIDAAIPLPLP